MSPATVRIDRFEDDVAVLVHAGRSFNFPRSLLPTTAREGDTLRLELSVDEAATAEARAATAAKRAKLSKDDDGGDFSL